MKRNHSRNRQARNEKATRHDAKSVEEEEPPVVKKVYTPKYLFTKTDEELHGVLTLGRQGESSSKNAIKPNGAAAALPLAASKQPDAPSSSSHRNSKRKRSENAIDVAPSPIAQERNHSGDRQARNEKAPRHDAKSAEEEEPPVVKKVYTPKGLFTKTDEELYECNELFSPLFKRKKLSTVNTPSTTPTLKEKALVNSAKAKSRDSSTSQNTPSTAPMPNEKASANSTKAKNRVPSSSHNQNTPTTAPTLREKATVNSSKPKTQVSSSSQNTPSTDQKSREKALVNSSAYKTQSRVSATSSNQQTKSSESNLTRGRQGESSSKKSSKPNDAAAALPIVPSKQPDAPSSSSHRNSKRKRSENAPEEAPSPIAQKMFPYKLRGKAMVVAVSDEPMRKKVMAEIKRYGIVIATSIDKNSLPYCIISDNINATLLEEKPDHRLPKVAIDDFPSPLREAVHLKVRVRDAYGFVERFKEFRQKDEPPMPLLFEWQHVMHDAATIRAMMAERNRYLEYQRRHDHQSPSGVEIIKVKEETTKPPAAEVIQLD